MRRRLHVPGVYSVGGWYACRSPELKPCEPRSDWYDTACPACRIAYQAATGHQMDAQIDTEFVYAIRGDHS